MAGLLIPTFPRARLYGRHVQAYSDLKDTVSLIVPFYHEGTETFRRSANGLLALQYPENLLEILWVVGSDDIAAQDSARDVFEECRERIGGPIGDHWRIICVPNISPKAKALNAAVAQSQGNIIGFLDADVVPEPSQLMRAVTVLAAHELDAVDAPEFPDTPHKWWSPVLHAEQVAWFSSMLWFDLLVGSHLLGGSSVYFRRSILEELGPFCETTVEDPFYLSLQFASLGLRAGLLESYSHGAPVRGLWAGIRQRGRWARGQFEVLSHSPRLLYKSRSAVLAISAAISNLAALAYPIALALAFQPGPAGFAARLMLVAEGLRILGAVSAPKQFGWPSYLSGWLLLPLWELCSSLGYWLAICGFIARKRGHYKARF